MKAIAFTWRAIDSLIACLATGKYFEIEHLNPLPLGLAEQVAGMALSVNVYSSLK